MFWDTKYLLEVFNAMPLVKSAKATGQGGDYDTNNIVVSIEGSRDKLHIEGYLSTEEPLKDINSTEVVHVAISDGMDSRGGLNSRNKSVAQVYVLIRQHFIDRGANIINHYSEIF